MDSDDRTSGDTLVNFLSTALNGGQPFVPETCRAILWPFDRFAARRFISRCAPEQIALGYTRMRGFPPLQSAPRHICMIGLGGGSLAKYGYRHLTGVAIDAVGINPAVIVLRDSNSTRASFHPFAERALCLVAHAVSLEVLADQLPHHLRHRQILCCAEHFKGFFLRRIDQDGQAFGFRFHCGEGAANMPIELYCICFRRRGAAGRQPPVAIDGESDGIVG